MCKSKKYEQNKKFTNLNFVRAFRTQLWVDRGRVGRNV